MTRRGSHIHEFICMFECDNRSFSLISFPLSLSLSLLSCPLLYSRLFSYPLLSSLLFLLLSSRLFSYPLLSSSLKQESADFNLKDVKEAVGTVSMIPYPKKSVDCGSVGKVSSLVNDTDCS